MQKAVLTQALAARPGAKPRTHELLARVLDEPGLVQAVRALPAGAISALVQHLGLEDAGELIGLASSEQLGAVLDADLWSHARIGQDETFDAQRFALWLEVMLEAGEDAVADKIVELPDELVTLGFHRLLLVLDMDALGQELAETDERDADLIEKALDGALSEELEEFRLIARRHDGWDAVLSVILALDKNHHGYLTRLLERLAHASREWIDDNGGLYEALSNADVIESDAAAEREDRRAREGFVAPAMARSFLSMIEAQDDDAVLAETGRDPITRAYFRELGDLKDAPAPAGGEAQVPRSLLDLLRAANVDDAVVPARLLQAPAGSAEAGADLFRQAMRELSARDPALHAQRLEELVFVASILVAGVAQDGRALRTIEAVEQAVAACNTALKKLRRKHRKSATVDLLVQHPTEKLFRIGFRK